MGLLEEIVQERDLDPELMRQTSSTFQNLSKFEKIQRLNLMDLLEESHLLQNLSARYDLPMFSTTHDAQNHENLPLSKKLFAVPGHRLFRTHSSLRNFGSELTGARSKSSQWHRKKIDTPCNRTLLSHNGINCSASDQRRYDRLERVVDAVSECSIIESRTDL